MAKQKKDGLETTYIGRICVDSGRVLLTDPVRASESEDPGLVAAVGREIGAGAIVNTLIGDGPYPVFARMMGSDCLGVFIDFTHWSLDKKEAEAWGVRYEENGPTLITIDAVMEGLKSRGATCRPQ